MKYMNQVAFLHVCFQSFRNIYSLIIRLHIYYRYITCTHSLKTENCIPHILNGGKYKFQKLQVNSLDMFLSHVFLLFFLTKGFSCHA
jgi:hypothetical protein